MKQLNSKIEANLDKINYIEDCYILTKPLYAHRYYLYSYLFMHTRFLNEIK